jgi:methylenetetrahydrofolate reductase (NADH)
MPSTVLARDLTTTRATDLPVPALPASRQQIIDLLADFSIETTPAAVARHGGLGLLPARTRVYIAFVPGDDWRNVAAAARQIRAADQTPVPHFPARSITSEGMLDAFLRQLADEAGVEQVLVIGGGLDQPQGPFASSQALLETGLLERYGVRTIGIAGHPEGEPLVRQPGLSTTHRQKLDYARRSTAALRLVTQFVFEAEPVLDWEHRIRADGLPIHVGVPGPATLKSLLAYAKLCGIGNSVRVLTRQGGNLLRLARMSYPDALITALARHRAAEPESRIERLHFYPFGGLARTARWLEAARAGAFTLHDDGLGFTVDPERG